MKGKRVLKLGITVTYAISFCAVEDLSLLKIALRKFGKVFIFGVFTALLLFVCEVGFGQATFNSSAVGNWNNSGSWTIISGSDVDGIPDADDIVEVIGNHDITVTANAGCAQLTVNGNSNNQYTLLTVNTNITLTIGGAFSIYGGNGNRRAEFINNGTMEFASTVSFGTDNVRYTNTVGNNSTFNYNGNTDQTVTEIPGGISYSNLTLSGSGTKTYTVSGARTANALTVNSGVTLLLNGTNSLTPVSASIYGTVRVQNTASLATGSGTINFYANSTYEHAREAGTIPTASWNTNSTCLITGVTTSTLPNGLSQNFYNLTWNCSGQATGNSLANSDYSISGTLTVASTGSSTLQLIRGSYTGNVASYLQTGGEAFLGGNTTSNKTLNVSGSFLLQGGTFNIDNGGGTSTSSLYIGGNFSKTGGTFTRATTTASTSQVVFNGSSAQTFSSNSAISGNVYYALNNSSGLSLLSDMTVNSGATLTLTSGRLTLGAYNLTVNSDISGSFSSSNMVAINSTGNLIRNYTTTGTYLFPVGSASPAIYSPIEITANTASAGSINVNLINNNDMSAVYESYLLRLWTITAPNISNYNITCNYNQSDVVGTETDLSAGKYDTKWVFYNGVNTGGDNFSINGLTSFSSFSAAVKKPKVTASADPTTVCSGSTVNLSATVKNGTPPYTWEWTSNPSGFSEDEQNTTANPTVTTTYTVTVTDDNGEFDSDDATVTVNPLPQGSLTSNGPFCVTGAGQLTWTATTGTGPYTVIYNDGTADRTASNVTSGTAFNVFTTPVTSTTTYNLVSVTDNNGCVRSSGFTGGSATITVNPLPEGSLTSNGPFCVTGAGQLTWTATTGTGPYTVIYNDGTADRTASNVTSGTAFNVFTTPVTSTTTYNLVSVTDNNGCVRSSGFTGGSATITVNPLPQGSITSNGPFCATGAGQLTWTATTGTGPYTVIYNDGTADRTASNVTSGTAFNVFTTPVTSTTTYNLVSVTDNNGCVRSSGFAGGSATITVNPLPSAPGGTGGSRCGTGTVNISATPGGGETIDWYDASSGGNLLLSGNINYTTPSISATTSYYAQARNTTTNCVSATRTAVVATVNPIPTITLGPDPESCAIDVIAYLTYSGTTGSPNRYNIEYDNTEFADVSNRALTSSPIELGTPSIDAGNYKGTLTVFNNSTGCYSSDYEFYVIKKDINATIINTTQAADSTIDTGDFEICPELIPPEFEPENSDYDPGVTNIDFRVEREYSLTTNDWEFHFDLTLTDDENYLSYEDMIYQLIIRGDKSGVITSYSETLGPDGEYIRYTISGIDDDHAYFRFVLNNLLNTRIYVYGGIGDVHDIDADCDEYDISDNDSGEIIIDGMPAVGPFN